MRNEAKLARRHERCVCACVYLFGEERHHVFRDDDFPHANRVGTQSQYGEHRTVVLKVAREILEGGRGAVHVGVHGGRGRRQEVVGVFEE